MAVQFIIDGITFGPMNSADGFKAVEMDPGLLIYSLGRHHACGTDGNYITRNGLTGGAITATCKYIGPTTTIYAAYETHMQAWANKAVEITTIGGQVYERCQIDKANIIKRSETMGTGNNRAWFIAEFKFTVDGGIA